MVFYPIHLGWYFMSKDPLNIRFPSQEKELRKNVKRVMEVIVWLLKDRVKEPLMKRQRVQKIIVYINYSTV